MPRQFNNKRKCKGLCENEYLYGIRVFPQKRLPYSKASYCSECEKSVLPPSVQKIVVTHKGDREEFPYKISFPCPCCKSICRGGPLSKTKPKPKPKPKPEYLKSYKELGLKKTPTRGTPDIKKDIEDLLERDTLGILKAYDEMVFGLKPNNQAFNEIIEILRGYNSITSKYDKKVTPEEQQRYQKGIIKQLDKYARKHKLGLFGMTKEEEKIESKKRLNEAIRRDAEGTGEYVPVVDIITDDKEDETKTNNVKGH